MNVTQQIRPAEAARQIRRLFAGPRRAAASITLAALILFSALWWWGTDRLEAYHLVERRSALTTELAPYGSALTAAINGRFALLHALQAFAETEVLSPNAHLDEEFAPFAAGLYANTSGIRYLSLAPGGIQQYVYPLQGNSALVGRNLLQDERPALRADVRRAVDSASVTLSGPDEGRLSLTGRQPIYRDGAFWGLATIELDLLPILTDAGVADSTNHLAFALRRETGAVFYGDAALFAADPVIYTIELPDGTWELGAVPSAGWRAAALPRDWPLVRGAGLLLVLTLTAMAYLLVSRHARLDTAVTQKTVELNAALQQLQESQSRLQHIFLAAPVGMGVIANGTFLQVNDSFCALLGYSCGELIGHHWRLVFPTDADYQIVSRVADQDSSHWPGEPVESRFLRKDGSISRVLVNMMPLDPAELSAGITLTAVDVTARRQSELALQASEARYRNIFHTTTVAIAEHDLSAVKTAVTAVLAGGVLDFGAYLDAHPEFVAAAMSRITVLDVNEATLRMYQTDDKAALLAAFNSCDRPPWLAAFRDELLAIAAGSPTFQCEVSTRTLQDEPLEVIMSVTFPAAEEGWDNLAVSLIDITERKRAERELLVSKDRLSKVMIAANDGTWDWNLQTGVLNFDRRYYEMAGYAEDAFPHTIAAFTSRVHPDDRQEVLEQARRHIDGEVDRYVAEFRFRKQDGGWLWVRSRGIVVERDAAGLPLRFVGTHTDITERKRAEQELVRYRDHLETLVAERTAEIQRRVANVEQLNNGMLNLLSDLQAANEHVLRTAQQLEETNAELESFAYSVSHDLRAPLRHIGGFVSLLKEREGRRMDSKSAHYLEVIIAAAGKMSLLIDDLLAFSRTSRQDLFTRQVDMDRLVAESRLSVEPDVGGRDISWKVEPLPAVTADAALLRQVWINLLENAVKYTGPRPHAQIEIGAYAAEETHERVFFVRDNGVGFDPRYVDKLFGVFQRLHRPDEFEGTGIGLATVRRIIHRHNGRVWAEGEVDKGATFYFSLPDR